MRVLGLRKMLFFPSKLRHVPRYENYMHEEHMWKVDNFRLALQAQVATGSYICNCDIGCLSFFVVRGIEGNLFARDVLLIFSETCAFNYSKRGFLEHHLPNF